MSIADARGAARVDEQDAAIAMFAADVRHFLNLQPKQLPSHYLYDPLGSALFSALGLLPWYRITAAETGLLERHADDILAHAPWRRIVELGSGNGEKLAVLLSAHQRSGSPLDVHLVDVSGAALAAAGRLLGAFDGVAVIPHRRTYSEGVADASRFAIPGERTLVLFLGSNIGNFDPSSALALLRDLRAHLRAGDAMLLGADLVKSPADLLLAYDDPLGVTAAFNRNLLVRINRELGGDFDVASFAHRAIWNRPMQRIEMHLVSTRAQAVRIARADLQIAFADGESIWTESSYKYRAADVSSMLHRAGFRTSDQWIDDDAGFALTLATVDADRV